MRPVASDGGDEAADVGRTRPRRSRRRGSRGEQVVDVAGTRPRRARRRGTGEVVETDGGGSTLHAFVLPELALGRHAVARVLVLDGGHDLDLGAAARGLDVAGVARGGGGKRRGARARGPKMQRLSSPSRPPSRCASSVLAKNMSTPHSSSMDRSVWPLRPMTKPMQSPGTMYALKSSRLDRKTLDDGKRPGGAARRAACPC